MRMGPTFLSLRVTKSGHGRVPRDEKVYCYETIMIYSLIIGMKTAHNLRLCVYFSTYISEFRVTKFSSIFMKELGLVYV